MYITHKKGQIAVCEIQRRALDNDIIISIPTTEERYDLILDDHGKLYRAQVKYSSGGSSDGSTCVYLRRECRNNGYSKRYNSDEIDIVLAYLPEEDKVVFIPPELFNNKSVLTVRTKPSKNNQIKGVTFLKDLRTI